MSGMGVAAGDYEGDGRQAIFRSNFSDERETLYRNRGRGEFDDVTIAAGLGRNTRGVSRGGRFLRFPHDWRAYPPLGDLHTVPAEWQLRTPRHSPQRHPLI